MVVYLLTLGLIVQFLQLVLLLYWAFFRSEGSDYDSTAIGFYTDEADDWDDEEPEERLKRGARPGRGRRA